MAFTPNRNRKVAQRAIHLNGAQLVTSKLDDVGPNYRATIPKNDQRLVVPCRRLQERRTAIARVVIDDYRFSGMELQRVHHDARCLGFLCAPAEKGAFSADMIDPPMIRDARENIGRRVAVDQIAILI